MKKIVLTCVLVFSACCVTLFAQKDKKEKETVKIECCCEDCTCRKCKCDAAIIIVITRNTEEADVAEDVKQSLPQIIKSEVVHFKPAQPHFLCAKRRCLRMRSFQPMES